MKKIILILMLFCSTLNVFVQEEATAKEPTQATRYGSEARCRYRLTYIDFLPTLSKRL